MHRLLELLETRGKAPAPDLGTWGEVRGADGMLSSEGHSPHLLRMQTEQDGEGQESGPSSLPTL